MQDLVWDISGKDQRLKKVGQGGESMGRHTEKGIEGPCHL